MGRARVRGFHMSCFKSCSTSVKTPYARPAHEVISIYPIGNLVSRSRQLTTTTTIHFYFAFLAKIYKILVAFVKQ